MDVQIEVLINAFITVIELIVIILMLLRLNFIINEIKGINNKIKDIDIE